MSVSYRELIRFVWQFMRHQKGVFFLILFFDIFAWPLEAMLAPYILHLIIDIFTKFEANRMAGWHALQGPIIGMLALVLYIEIASRAMGFLMAKAVPRLQSNIRMHMFDHVQRHSPRYFNERFAGSLANKITDMTTQVDSIIQQLFWPLVPAIAACIFGVIFFWFVNPLFTWILAVWIVIHMAVSLKFAKRCDLYEQRHGEERSHLLGQIVDSLTNNFAVNLFFRFRHENKAIIPFQQTEERTNVKSKSYVEQMRCVTSVFYFLIAMLGILIALVYLWLHNKITTGQVVQIFNAMGSIGAIMWAVGTALPVLFQSFGTAKQSYSVMQDPQDICDNDGALDLKISSGAIVFDDVSFRYGDKQLFQNKHVEIRGGERVGLVGFSGAGKSTFINLILRFFPLDGGKIIIDNQDINTITLESLRRQVALIPQDPLLFHRTLRENIAYGKPEATEAEIFEAARLAHCDEFIRNIPMHYEAKVGERGTKLSGGEKQRIAIARAILLNAPILILDEATSALDSVTERYIQDSLEKLMQNRTTIAIAHRLSTLSSMDRILVFDKGKIVEEGSHVELLSKQGLYAKMWNMQVGGFLPDSV